MMNLLTPLCSGINVSCYVSKAANAAFTSMVQAFGDGTVQVLKFLSTVWMKLPSPTVATGGGNSYAPTQVISDMQLWLGPLTAAIAACSFAVQLVNVARKADRTEMEKAVRQLLAVAAAPLAIVALTQVLIGASDAFSPWLITQATGKAGLGLDSIISQQMLTDSTNSGAGLWLILFLLATLGSLAQALFMVVRAPVLMLLMVALGPTAAATASDQGWHRFKRLLMLILGFVLYKPVAAIIYAFGLTMITKNGNSLTNALYGLAVIAMAALALPALIKFLAPDAALGSSSLASGAALAGGVAAGATLAGGFAGGAGAAGAASRAGGTSQPAPTTTGGPSPRTGGPTGTGGQASAAGATQPAPTPAGGAASSSPTGAGGGSAPGSGGGRGAVVAAEAVGRGSQAVREAADDTTEGAA